MYTEYSIMCTIYCLILNAAQWQPNIVNPMVWGVTPSTCNSVLFTKRVDMRYMLCQSSNILFYLQIRLVSLIGSVYDLSVISD